MVSSHRIKTIVIVYFYRGHSTNTSLGRKDEEWEGVDKENNKK